MNKSSHSVRFFDSPKARISRIADYVREGLASGGSVLVVATKANLLATSEALAQRGISVADAIEDGRVTVLDAGEALRAFMRADRPDPALLEEAVGSLVNRLAQQPGRLHIYGEMVDVLAESGNLTGALRLEELWNGLADRVPFDLFCGYTSGHFGNERSAAALRSICAAHSEVHRHPDDMMGNALIERSQQA